MDKVAEVQRILEELRAQARGRGRVTEQFSSLPGTEWSVCTQGSGRSCTEWCVCMVTHPAAMMRGEVSSGQTLSQALDDYVKDAIAAKQPIAGWTRTEMLSLAKDIAYSQLWALDGTCFGGRVTNKADIVDHMSDAHSQYSAAIEDVYNTVISTIDATLASPEYREDYTDAVFRLTGTLQDYEYLLAENEIGCATVKGILDHIDEFTGTTQYQNLPSVFSWLKDEVERIKRLAEARNHPCAENEPSDQCCNPELMAEIVQPLALG